MAYLSVIIPCYNGESYLAEALDSIQRQPLQDIEIIILDDGSTDRSVEVAQSHGARVTLIQQTNKGSAAARQAGIQAASGELLAFCDADDIWTADRFPAQVEFMEAFGATACCGMSQSFMTPELQNSRGVNKMPPPEYYRTFNSLLIRRAVMQRIGRLPEDGPDLHIPLFAALQDLAVDVLQYNQVVTLRRVHESNRSRNIGPLAGGYARAIKGVLERRRQLAREVTDRTVAE